MPGVVTKVRPLVRTVLTTLLLACSLLVATPAGAVGTGSITGVVTREDGSPVDGATVSVRPQGTSTETLWETGSDGRFTATGLAAGSYAVCFRSVGEELAGECWEDLEPTYRQHTPVPVAEGEAVTGIDAELLPALYLRGTVTDSRGLPVAGVRVSAVWFIDDGTLCCISDTTGPDGTFAVGELYSGDYTLQFSDPEQRRYATEWWSDATVRADATHVRLERGRPVDGLDATLAERPHLSGTLRGAGGVAARGAQVQVYRVHPGGSPSLAASTTPAADGSYDVSGLEPGTYRLGFDAAPGMFRSEHWDDVRRLADARDVVVGSTSVDGIDGVLAVAPAVRLRSAPQIRGDARVGDVLRVSTGTWDVRRLAYTYRWRADGKPLARGDRPRLRVTRALLGTRLTVRVTATALDRERSPGSTLTAPTRAVRPHWG